MKTTHDFKDGKGPVPAARHSNPGDTEGAPSGGWVAATAAVASTVYIGKDAQVYGNAWVSGSAWVYDNAWVFGDARVYDNARVFGSAWVYDNAWVFGDARVYDNARVFGHAGVYGDAGVYGNARVYGDARVSEGAHVGSSTEKEPVDKEPLTWEKLVEKIISYPLGTTAQKSKFIASLSDSTTGEIVAKVHEFPAGCSAGKSEFLSSLGIFNKKKIKVVLTVEVDNDFDPATVTPVTVMDFLSKSPIVDIIKQEVSW